jgi:transposase
MSSTINMGLHAPVFNDWLSTSLLEHWAGLRVFVEHPEVPMDNNRAESSIRTPVNGRKSYYGSGSIWSAELAAMLFSILQTLLLWGINPRHWLACYLHACAENGAQAPRDIEPFLPWSMDEARRSTLRDCIRTNLLIIIYLFPGIVSCHPRPASPYT